MKKLTLSLIAASCFVTSSAGPAGAEIDGTTLLDTCKEAERYMEDKNRISFNVSSVNFCAGYISGVRGLHASFVSSVACFDPPAFCIPFNTNLERLVNVVVSFLENHPEDLHFQGSDLTVAAFKEAFPCP
jgi:hypothetical protein